MWKPCGHTRSKLHLFDVVCLVGDDVRLIVQTLFNVSASDITLMCLGHFIAEYQTNKQAYQGRGLVDHKLVQVPQ